MYLLPRVNIELRPKLLELKPGTRIVSHDFSMEDWKPDTQRHDGYARKVRRHRRHERHLLLGRAGQGRGHLALGAARWAASRSPTRSRSTRSSRWSPARRASAAARSSCRKSRLSGEDLALHVYRRRERRAGEARVLRQGRGRLASTGSARCRAPACRGSRNGTRAAAGLPARRLRPRVLPGRCAWLPACPVDAESDRHGARAAPFSAQFCPRCRRPGAASRRTRTTRPTSRRRRTSSTRCWRSPRSVADDYVIDLGSGDGRMVITAAKKLRRARLRGGPRPPAGGARQPQCREGGRGGPRGVLRARSLRDRRQRGDGPDASTCCRR